MVDADLREQKEKNAAKPRKVKPGATAEQKDTLLAFSQSEMSDMRQEAYIVKNLDKFTFEDAEDLLTKIATQENAK